MRRIRFISFAVVLLFFCVYPGNVRAKTESEKIKLDRIKSKIVQSEKKLQEYKKKEDEVIEKLDALERQLIRENIKVKEINSEIGDIKQNIQQYHKVVDRLKAEIADVKNDFDKRLVALYKYHNRSGLRILLSSRTYNDFLRQDKLLNRIVTDDYNLIKDTLRKIDDRIESEKKLREQRNRLLKEKEEYAKRTLRIASAKEDKISLLKKTRQEKELQLAAISELKRYARELQSFIDRLPEEEKDFHALTRKFSSMKGKLPFPVKGPILTRFGRKEHAELHTFTFQKGIEIKAPEGREIKSIFEGKVIFADWFKGYGNLLIINHGEKYYSLSAHASRLFKKTGDLVGQGETVALVGDTNSLKGSCLYFEIRHQGKPMDPLEWLEVE